MANTFQKTVLFKPSSLHKLQAGSTKINNITINGNKDDTQEEATTINTGSFRYDPSGFPLKNTQQLNVDWSKWEKHTFFNSAQVKVQTAFDKVINGFPFDGTKSEFIKYADSLSGFDKHILDSFPNNKGCLHFDSTNSLEVSDTQGTGVAKGKNGATGAHVLNFSFKPFTIEHYLFLPAQTNNNQIILQRLSGSTKGITLAVSQSASTNSAELYSFLTNELAVLSSSVIIQKNKFNHIATVYDRNDTGKLLMYVDGILVSSSSTAAKFDEFNFQDEIVTIGSGSLHSVKSLEFTPQTQLSGALDELRWFHERRSDVQIRNFKDKNIFSSKNKKLKMYFRFNEPSGSFGSATNPGNKNLVLDYSGNGLHTKILNFNMQQRNTGSLPTALVSEVASDSPILFPSYEGVTSLGLSLLESGGNYDINNPNLITRLVPKHYFLDAQEKEGFESETGDIGDNYGYGKDVPGGGKMPSSQIISSLLYIWAEQFDEIKMFIDEFGRALKVDYLSNDTISDQLLPFLARYYGLNLPNTFADASLEQLLDGQDIKLDKTKSIKGLQGIQNILWRRILTSLPEIIKSKGTRHSINVLFRNMGINPDGVFRIREFGGSRTRSISDSLERRHEIATLLDFSGSNSLLQSSYLSGTRVEPGIPNVAGAFINGASNNKNDGLFTSGSWSIESVFKLSPSQKNKQSLIRLQTTGSTFSGASNNWLVYNTIATPPNTLTSTEGSLSLFGRPTGGSSALTLKMEITGVNVYDGNKWHISFGRERNDKISSYTSSSYFLRLGRMSSSEIEEYHVTSSYFDDSGDNVLNQISGSTNAFGSFIVIGSQSLGYDSTLSAGGFLNAASDSSSRYVGFNGKISSTRFFTKALTEKETKTHIRNFKSIGVEDPKLNFNFNTTDSGSFERLRVNLSCDQPTTESNSTGEIQIFDFSQNNLHANCTGFEISKRIIKPERYDYMILSPRFETATDNNKVRVRSFQQIENIRAAGIKENSFAPLYKIPGNDQPKDDKRLAIEVSSVQALNEDIINIFATLDLLDNAIGNPELIFSREYRDLRNLRRIYFNRLDKKVSLTKFFEFFKWFDNTVGDLIEEVIPHTTRYLGTNFVVESHALERAKFTYSYDDMYTGILDRRESSVILLQQFVGTLKKF